LKGGPYKRYTLVIHTDEMFLEATKVEQWLTMATFRARRITDVALGLSYEPAQKCCPVFNCAFAAANKEFRQGRRVGRRVRGQPLTFLLKI